MKSKPSLRGGSRGLFDFFGTTKKEEKKETKTDVEIYQPPKDQVDAAIKADAEVDKAVDISETKKSVGINAYKYVVTPIVYSYILSVSLG